MALKFVICLAVIISNNRAENLSPYPMLYFSSSDVKEMRARALTTHAKIAADLREAGKALIARPDFEIPPKSHKTFASKWNEVYGNSLCGFSMYSFLYPEDAKVFDHIKTFMDRMSEYPDWYVAESYGKDQVPVGHSLTGFATAYDLLYDRLDEKRKEKYYDTIKRHTQHLFMLSKQHRFGWTKQYIHNHAASNFVGLLLGALIVSVQEPGLGSVWIKDTKSYLDFSMEILSHITDGTLDEGVSYGSYTSRGLTQYVYLAKRHLKTDHTKNPWLKEHFWFFHKTLLPGYQRAVGIADANHNWFFGPGSQLVFLDAYVMKNGYGNWLSAKIRRARPKNKPLAMTHAHHWSMLHTEYIFFNASIRPQKPPECDYKRLHVFHDWGVVTYGSSQDMKKGNTFLSFKSSVLNGEAVENMMYNNIYPQNLILPEWGSFNPGHEHPDQNSFVFAPNGRYFITEALYGPKFTYLDNVILFSTPDETSCLYPWKGQIGECSKWLKYSEYKKGMRGEILTAVTSNDNKMTFLAGESVGAYSETLGLVSVFRGLLLLNPEVLIVFDTVKLLKGSKTKRASAVFHNMLHRFKDTIHLGYEGAKVQYPEGSYSMFSMGKNELDISLHNGVQPAGLREGPTNYINVTFDLNTDVTNIVHVFSGPNYIIRTASILPKSGSTGVYASLNINGVEHLINVSTSTKSNFKKKSHIKERIDVTGCAGYASVTVDEKVFYFGLDNSAFNSDNSYIAGELSKRIINEDINLDTSSTKFTVSSGSNKCASSPFIDDRKLKKTSQRAPYNHTSAMNSTFLFAGAFIIFFVVLCNPGIRVHLTRKIRHSGKRPIYGIVSLTTVVLLNTFCIDSDGNNLCMSRLPMQNEEQFNVSERLSIPTTPFIFITSLPASGGELLESLFKNSDQFLYFTSPKDFSIPVKNHDSSKINVCLWPSLQNKFNLQTMGWFSSLIGKPLLHFNQENESGTILKIRRHLRQHFFTTFVLNDNTGFWNTKIPWIRRVVGKNSFQPMFVVRDPRSWINIILQDKNSERRKNLLQSLTLTYHDIEKSCDVVGLELPQLYQRFKQLEILRRSKLHIVEKLSIIWAITVANVMTNEEKEMAQWPLHIIRFEDLVDYPERASGDIFLKLGLPLGIRYINKLTRLVRSEFFKVPFDDIITPQSTTVWKTALSSIEVAKIEEICCPLMKILNYECKTT